MKLQDCNQTLKPPVGYELDSVTATGGYIRAEYHEFIFDYGISEPIKRVVVIYLNDSGREVARCISDHVSSREPELKPDIPVPRRYRFWNGVVLACHGLWEMTKCLR